MFITILAVISWFWLFRRVRKFNRETSGLSGELQVLLKQSQERQAELDKIIAGIEVTEMHRELERSVTGDLVEKALVFRGLAEELLRDRGLTDEEIAEVLSSLDKKETQ